MSHEYSIAILLPTRGRSEALSRSVISIVNRAVKKDQIQLLLAFDKDDEIGLECFKTKIQPYLDDQGVAYSAHLFDRLGYTGLNQYYNSLAKHTDSDWIFVWNDDAIMETTGWDNVVRKYNDQFKILKIHTHGEHPYSIFPIIPVAWYETIGYLSCHQMIDAEISQIAYMLDLIEIVDIYATHDRADLTGNNLDDTDKERIRYEGNPANPLDFHNPAFNNKRIADAVRIDAYMKANKLDTTWWDNVLANKQDPWVKMRANDVNKFMVHSK